MVQRSLLVEIIQIVFPMGLYLEDTQTIHPTPHKLTENSLSNSAITNEQAMPHWLTKDTINLPVRVTRIQGALGMDTEIQR